MLEPAVSVRRGHRCQDLLDGGVEGISGTCLGGAQQGLELDQLGSMGERSGEYGGN